MFTYFISSPISTDIHYTVHLVFSFSIEQMFSRNLTMRVSICLCYCVENTFPIPGLVPTYSHIIPVSAHIARRSRKIGAAHCGNEPLLRYSTANPPRQISSIPQTFPKLSPRSNHPTFMNEIEDARLKVDGLEFTKPITCSLIKNQYLI
jgi:hypothetical protein